MHISITRPPSRDDDIPVGSSVPGELPTISSTIRRPSLPLLCVPPLQSCWQKQRLKSMIFNNGGESRRALIVRAQKWASSGLNLVLVIFSNMILSKILRIFILNLILKFNLLKFNILLFSYVYLVFLIWRVQQWTPSPCIWIVWIPDLTDLFDFSKVLLNVAGTLWLITAWHLLCIFCICIFSCDMEIKNYITTELRAQQWASSISISILYFLLYVMLSCLSNLHVFLPQYSI